LRLYRAKGSQKEETKEWQCVAHTLAEWEALINVLQQSTDEQDQELYLYLNNELFPPIKTGLQVCPYSSREDADLWRFWIEASNCRWRERVRSVTSYIPRAESMPASTPISGQSVTGLSAGLSACVVIEWTNP